MGKRPLVISMVSTSDKDREQIAALQIHRMLGDANLKKNYIYAHALDVFNDLNKKICRKILKNWNVDLIHRDGSTLQFAGALLVQCDCWLCCFTKNHGVHVYHAGDLKHFENKPMFYPKKKQVPLGERSTPEREHKLSNRVPRETKLGLEQMERAIRIYVGAPGSADVIFQIDQNNILTGVRVVAWEPEKGRRR